MIISPSLPEINGLFGKFSWKSLVGQYLLMLMLGFINHRGRMSAQQAASAIVGRSRHRAGVCRFLESHGNELHWLRYRAAGRLLRKAPLRGRFLFIVDTTSVSHQGEKTENTFCCRPSQHAFWLASSRGGGEQTYLAPSMLS